MIIVIEGPDGSGKSTLAASLSERAGIPVWHPPGAVIEGDYSVIASQARDYGAVNMAVLSGADVIFDRSFPSEWVYGRAFDRDFDEFAVMGLDSAVSGVDHLGILINPRAPWDTWGRTDGHVADIDKYEELIQLYADYVERSSMNWLCLDATTAPELVLESVMYELASHRPDRDAVYMEMARAAMARSTCLARRVGAVMVSSSGHVIATGYNGAPCGLPHPDRCDRLRKGKSSGQGLDLCDDVHAEANVLIQVARHGGDAMGGTLYTTASPCQSCAMLIVNAGVSAVVYDSPYGDRSGLRILRDAGIRASKHGSTALSETHEARS